MLNLQQVLAKRNGDGFGTGGGAEFGEDDCEVFLDADGGDAELLGDVWIGKTSGDGLKDGQLLFRERRRQGIVLYELQAAASAAVDADVVIAVLGEDERRTGESRSRTSLELPGRQQALLGRLQATGKPVVLVLVNGQPLTVNWANRHVPAILESWFPGVRGGKSVAKALFGDLNPSGKLTMTFPKSVGQVEYNFPFKKGSHGRQNRLHDPNGDGVTRVVGALYPFGYGLSYTKFAYSDLRVTPESGSADQVWTVSCTVANVGDRSGAEVVQLYVRDRYSSVVAYDSVLRGFEKVALLPGERKSVTFVIEPADLQLLDKKMKWTVEPGDFDVLVGSSSEDIRLRSSLRVLADGRRHAPIRRCFDGGW